MGYVNFEEERFVANKQLQTRRKNNGKLITDILKKRSLPSNYNPDEKFSYKNFRDEFFGKKGMVGEADFKELVNKDIVCAKFIDCKFSNLTFKECRFIGCKFEGCTFDEGGVSFENCTFIKEESEKLPSLNREDNLSCEFRNCNIYAKFLNCIMSFIIFEQCSIQNTYFEQSDIESGIINKSDMNMIIIKDCDLTGAKIVKTYIEDIEFRDKYKTKMDEKTFIDKITLRKKDRAEYEGIYTVYETFANKFKENTLNNNFGEYYYLCKNTQRHTLKPFEKFLSYIYWLTCGYGERPVYAVITSLAIIVIFSFIYMIVGMDVDGETIRYTISNIRSVSFIDFIRNFNEAISLSVGMFGGVGANNSKPIEISYMIANIEMLIGIAMMGVGIGTLTRKIVR